MTDKPIRVRIIGGAEAWNTHIVDAETGREVRGVVAYSINGKAGEVPATMSIELVEFDHDLEIEATAKRFKLRPAMVPDFILTNVVWRLRQAPVVVYAGPLAFILLLGAMVLR